MHVHISAVSALVAFAYVIICGFAWRLIAAHNSQNAVGQAMAFLY